MGGYEQWPLDQLIAGRSPTNNGIHPKRFSLANSTTEDWSLEIWAWVWRFEFGVWSLKLGNWSLIMLNRQQTRRRSKQMTGMSNMLANMTYQSISDHGNIYCQQTLRSARQKQGLNKTHVTYPSWTWSFTRWRLGKVPDDPWIQLRDVESVFSIEDRLCWYVYYCLFWSLDELRENWWIVRIIYV